MPDEPIPKEWADAGEKALVALYDLQGGTADTFHQAEEVVRAIRPLIIEQARRDIEVDPEYYERICGQVREQVRAEYRDEIMSGEALRRAGEVMEDAALRLLGRDLGTVHRDMIALAGVRAALGLGDEDRL